MGSDSERIPNLPPTSFDDFQKLIVIIDSQNLIIAKTSFDLPDIVCVMKTIAL